MIKTGDIYFVCEMEISDELPTERDVVSGF